MLRSVRGEALDCGHATPAGGAGDRIDCRACDAFEIPAGYAPYRRTPEFTQDTVPAALTSRHNTKTGVWAHIHVVEGVLRYQRFEPFAAEERLEPGRLGIIAPEAAHAVAIVGPVRFFVEFLGPGGAPP